MATWSDVRAVAARYPGIVEATADGRPGWRVPACLLVWDRPLRGSDRAALGDDAPTGDVLGIRTVDLAAKDELLAALPAVFFTTPHFDGYPAVLARLAELPVDVLDDLVQRVWREKAPKRVVRGWSP